MDLQFKTFPFEVKAGAADGSTFEGLVSVFNNVDAYGEIVDPKAFEADLPDFMANGFIGGLNHDWNNPIGKPQAGTKVVDKGLHLVGNVLDTTHGMDVRKMLAGGVVKKLSIGFRTKGDMVLQDAEECMAYWKANGYTPNAQDMARCQGGARVLTRIQLFEGSPVTVPANDLATITAVKAARDAADAVYRAAAPAEDPKPDRLDLIRTTSSLSDFEDILRDAGFSGTESKAIISRLKSLPRDVVGDDAGPKPEDAITLDAPDPASETPAETPTETKSEDEPTPPASETIVTPATSDADPPDPLAKDLEQAKSRVIAAQTREQMRLRSLIYGDAAKP
jgi:HK97 family phage prohead protease